MYRAACPSVYLDLLLPFSSSTCCLYGGRSADHYRRRARSGGLPVEGSGGVMNDLVYCSAITGVTALFPNTFALAGLLLARAEVNLAPNVFSTNLPQHLFPGIWRGG